MINLLQKAGLVFSVCFILSCSTGQATTSPITPEEETTIISPINYIGLKYPPLPSSIRTSTNWGRAIWKQNTPISWAVDAVMDENNLMLWLSKVTHHDESGHAFFEVRDVLLLPSSTRDKDFVVGECVISGKPDFELVALVNLDEERLNTRWLPNSNILSVWRANLSTEKFEELSTENIECNAETFINFP